MSKSPGRLEVLSLIDSRGCEVTYADTGFVAPNKWISNDIIHDFEARGLIERDGKQARVTEKGQKVLAEKGS